MITATSIHSGESYLKKHLRANDYYSEGETVEGEWVGKGAKMLGLEGAVGAEEFEALRKNLHSATGEKLTERDRGARGVAFHDIVFSAPKAASILAVVGGDERVRQVWEESVKVALAEMENFAAVRLRTGEDAGSEKLRITGNVTGALFFHDASRELDPQLHAHAVLANASHDREGGRWLALQRRAMMEASPYIREVAAGDALLFRANCPEISVSNGDRVQVAAVDSDKKTITLKGGKVIPENFAQFCHGHAVTSHKSQGASVQESLMVFGPGSLGAINLRQCYVSNTRFKENHHLYIHDLEKFGNAIGKTGERKLACEFVAELGRDLGALLAESSNTGDRGIGERETKIRGLMREIAKHERGTRTPASYRAFLEALGANRLPERVRRWLDERRENRSRNRRAAAARKSYALARSVRKAHQVAGWWRRVGARPPGQKL